MYQHNHKAIRIGEITTSKKEIIDLAKAWIVISVAFAILLSGFGFSSKFLFSILMSAFTVGTGFLVHELAHKIVAQHYGCFAEFRSFDTMLMLALAMSFFGFVFAAPGAVMINGPVGIRRNGKISMAGPLTNILFAIIFLIGLFFFKNRGVHNIAFYGFVINSWLGLFNMLPFWNFDGKKILQWNKVVYGSMVAVGILFLVLQNVARSKGWF